jgi:putative ABC transport system substrate-binding protein
MRRREFITLLGGAALGWPLAARAQSPKRLGVLVTFTQDDADAQSFVQALLQRLGDYGWRDARNLSIEYRWGAAERSRAQGLAQELIETRPDLIIASGGPAAAAVSRTTRAIPVVFVQVIDPVALGIVPNMARPGGNLTGFTHFEAGIGGKWLELLKEIAPGISRVVVLLDPDNPASPIYLRGIEQLAPSFGLRLHVESARNAAEIERSLNAVVREPNSAVVMVPNPVAIRNRELTISLMAKLRLPAVYPHSYFVKHGGLLSYGVDLIEMYRQSATYVDRILRGERPGDLPVQAPTKYELMINLKTAKALGLDVPWIMQQRADEVIE